MKKYYTRACNFSYGIYSRKLIKKKRALPLNGNLDICFEHIEIISRNSSKTISLNNTKTSGGAWQPSDETGLEAWYKFQTGITLNGPKIHSPN